MDTCDGQKCLIGDSCRAQEDISYRPPCAAKLEESAPSASGNSDYAAALRVWHEYSLHCRKYGLDCSGDFPRWTTQRLNSEEPNCA
jgi:hypothetical protein